MTLEILAMRWLRWKKNCPIVLRERSPREWLCDRPDVLGITASRYMVEIEIKRSVSDFRADFSKASRATRNLRLDFLPKHFYYLVPANLVLKVRDLVPEWAGLLSAHQAIAVLKAAPSNLESRKLTIKECCRLVHLVSNHAVSEAEGRYAAWRRFREGVWPDPEPEYEI